MLLLSCNVLYTSRVTHVMLTVCWRRNGMRQQLLYVMKLRARDTFWMVRTGLLEHLVSCFCKTNRRPRSRRPISAVLLSLPFIARNRTTVVRASPTTVGPSNPSENHSPHRYEISEKPERNQLILSPPLSFVSFSFAFVQFRVPSVARSLVRTLNATATRLFSRSFAPPYDPRNRSIFSIRCTWLGIGELYNILLLTCVQKIFQHVCMYKEFFFFFSLHSFHFCISVCFVALNENYTEMYIWIYMLNIYTLMYIY